MHGCLDSLKRLLDVVSPEKGDKVVMLGDYVDRGPDSRGVIDYLLEWPWEADLVTLKGNHEAIMGEAGMSDDHMDYWERVGGLETLGSYGGKLENIPEEHWEFIRGCEPYYQTKKVIYVHGGVEAGKSLKKQNLEDMAWHRFHDARAHLSGKLVVCGHTIQRDGVPSDKGHTICIDTGACRGGWLTCLEARTRKFWQTNEDGEVRLGMLKTSQRKGKGKKGMVLLAEDEK